MPFLVVPTLWPFPLFLFFCFLVAVRELWTLAGGMDVFPFCRVAPEGFPPTFNSFGGMTEAKLETYFFIYPSFWKKCSTSSLIAYRTGTGWSKTILRASSSELVSLDRLQLGYHPTQLSFPLLHPQEEQLATCSSKSKLSWRYWNLPFVLYLPCKIINTSIIRLLSSGHQNSKTEHTRRGLLDFWSRLGPRLTTQVWKFDEEWYGGKSAHTEARSIRDVILGCWWRA